MIVAKVVWNEKELGILRAIGNGVMPALMRRMLSATVFLERHLKISAVKNLKRTSSAGYSGRKTGKLAQSVTHIPPHIEGKTIVSSVGTNSPYGRMRELGGTITAKHSAALTIPIPGRNFGSASSLRSSGRTFVRNNIIFLKQGKNKIIPIFLLRKAQSYEPQNWVTEGLKDATPRIKQLLGENFQKEIITDANG